MLMIRHHLILIFLFFSFTAIYAQNTAVVYGVVEDTAGKPFINLPIVVTGMENYGTFTDDKGNYKLTVPAEKFLNILYYSEVGTDTVELNIRLDRGERFEKNVTLTKMSIIVDVVPIYDDPSNLESAVEIKAEELEYLPGPNDAVTQAIKHYGAISNNETSASYSVRGGNFDENLIYVNGFQIYRPLIVRSGEQEGLPFYNSQLIDKIYFSTGGFQPMFGDKLSSVLDITYKNPQRFNGSFNGSLLGGGIHLEGSNYLNTNKNKDSVVKDPSLYKYFLFGTRYKSNQYLLNALPTTGQYKPSFLDIQGLIGFDLDPIGRYKLEIIGNYSRNKFQFIPEDQISSTGVVNNVIQLEVFFDGQEIDQYETGMLGISLDHKINDRTKLTYRMSGFQTTETETFDIIGDYWIGLVESNLGDDEFGQVKYALGVGTFHEFGRNYIDATIANGEIVGSWFSLNNKHTLRWGAKWQNENITDNYTEWLRLDSSGFSLPQDGLQVNLSEVLKTEINISSNRYSAYLQDKWINQDDKKRITVTGGARMQFWDLNQEVLISPRLQAAWQPLKTTKKKTSISYKAAAGLYHQSPFYREMRNREGLVNTNVLAQKSAHFVAGTTLNFTAGERKFKFSSEVFYKHMWDLIPYDIDNVRITYYGDNLAKGYAAGVEMRLFGELVEDAESWMTLTILQTKEDIEGDSTYNDQGELVEQGYISRPTNQRVNFGLYFQDYIPGNKNYQMHLSLLFGSGLPFGPPNSEVNRNAFKAPPYRRVDIGFAALLFDKANRLENDKGIPGVVRPFNSVWASLEVFNLLGVSNTVSYIWVKDVSNTQYAFPNFLTSRRLNFKLIAKFGN